MAKVPRKRPRTTTKVRPDGDDEKIFPTGISATVLAIQNYWLSLTNGADEFLKPEDFCAGGNFIEVYSKVANHYAGIIKKPKKPGGIARMIHRISNGKEGVQFFHLRAFAEFVGLPTGLFLLFTQMASDERRALEDNLKGDHRDPREEALTFIRRVKKTIEAVEHHVEHNVKTGELISIHTYPGPSNPTEAHMAKARMLKVWSDAYNASNQSIGTQVQEEQPL